MRSLAGATARCLRDCAKGVSEAQRENILPVMDVMLGNAMKIIGKGSMEEE